MAVAKAREATVGPGRSSASWYATDPDKVGGSLVGSGNVDGLNSQYFLEMTDGMETAHGIALASN
jgi:hypothetical protein